MTGSISNAQRLTGRILGGLVTLFMVFDGGLKIAKPAAVIEATVRLGYRETSIAWIGVVLVLCAVLYALPRTSFLGAILLTGYLGGAVATHVRVGDPPFTIAFAAAFGVLAWGSLWLRDGRVRSLVSLRAARPTAINPHQKDDAS